MLKVKKGILFCLSIATAGFFVACDDDPSSPNNANSAQENILPEETVNSSSSVKAISVSSSGEKEDTPVYTVETGSVIDERDGQIYKTVTIGTQTWLAQNLNYETVNSFCYNDTASYCDKYGRLYTWDAAMDACPSGWHLPSQTEWNTLLNTLGGNAPTGRKNSERLRSTLGWIKGNGTDAFSFSTLSAGGRGRNGDYSGEGHSAYFWSSTEDRSRSVDAYIMRLDIYGVQLSSAHKVNGYSVRCLKGDAPVQTQESSSSETAISSSSVKSSSSVVVIYDSTDTLIDSRDGQTYKTVTIGSQTWMAENLRFEYKVRGSAYGNTYLIINGNSKLAIYGRYYTWAAAMDSAGIYSKNGKGCGYKANCSPTYPVRGICPEGWHLPDTTAWKTLYEAIGKNPYAMQSTQFAKWKNATNTSGFSAFPAGGYLSDFYDDGSSAYFWSSRYLRSNQELAYYWMLNADDAYLDSWGGHNRLGKLDHYSVRCLKDSK